MGGPAKRKLASCDCFSGRHNVRADQMLPVAPHNASCFPKPTERSLRLELKDQYCCTVDNCVLGCLGNVSCSLRGLRLFTQNGKKLLNLRNFDILLSKGNHRGHFSANLSANQQIFIKQLLSARYCAKWS